AHGRAETSDGLLDGRRLQPLGSHPPYYRARLETDRACALGFWWHHTVIGGAAGHRSAGAAAATSRPEVVLTSTAAARRDEETDAWSDREHGFAYVRGTRRTASVSWRAATRTQLLAFPTERPDMAEWAHNLCPVLRFEGDGRASSTTESPHPQRRGARHTPGTLPGGVGRGAPVGGGVARVAG